MVITYEAYDLEYSNPIKFINNNKYDMLLIKNPNSVLLIQQRFRNE